MNKITSINEYKEIIAKAKNEGYKQTNCYFLSSDIHSKVCSGSLFYQPIDHGVLLLEDKISFFRCYYYLHEDCEQSELLFGKDVVIEVPFLGELDDTRKNQIRILKVMGFDLGRESGMIKALPQKVSHMETDEDRQVCCIASEEDADQVFKLLYNTFSPLYSYLPDRDELVSIILKKRVFVIKNNKTLLGALLSNQEKNIATINQLVISENYRGRGMGNKLIKYYHDYYFDRVNAYQHWVDLNNTAAISMYLKNGYEFTLRKANEYIKINGGKEK